MTSPFQPKAVSRATNKLPQVNAPAGPSPLASENDPDLAARIAHIRETRVESGDSELRLSAEQRPGFMRRWINDNANGRVARMRKRGWEVVTDGDGKPMETTVGTKDEGGRLQSYLLEIPLEIYDEDQEKKQRALDEIDMAVAMGRHNEEANDGRYVPTSTPIKIGMKDHL